MKIKYPRTPHLSWSPGATSDDVHHVNLQQFIGRQVVVTEKMDGENTTLYRDDMHARSIDGRYHPSRAWVKALQANIGYQIPHGWRICGENLYAQHSIAYNELASYFLAFSVWDDNNNCLSWADTQVFLTSLGLSSPKVIYQGQWCEKTIRNIELDLSKQEGYVVRLADTFNYRDFKSSVAKWVRPNHVTSDKHWMHQQIIANKLRESIWDDENDNGGHHE